jgi:hypothetical protein
MQAFAIPRVDAGAEGIHLVWAWSPVLPISIDGYDVQRLGGGEERWIPRCETIDSALIAFLRARAEYPAPLGPLRMRGGARFAPLDDARLHAAAKDPGDHPPGFGDPKPALTKAGISAVLAASPLAAASTGALFDEFIQELTGPVERATVQVTARIAVAIALREGKSVALGVGGASPATIELLAPAIDTIVVYALAPETLTICVYDRSQQKDDADWGPAPYLAKHLTLPVHEADPGLATPAQELAAAHARLLGGETLAAADFERLAATLRDPAAAAALGRSGERTSLVRSDKDQSYEEMPFDVQLGALALHPRSRRMLGFGFADRKGLTPGSSYRYRITGRFDAADLSDAIYAVHRIPASTVLPAAFSIRDVGFRFQVPVKVVLDPAPSASALHAASRRGIRIDTTGYDTSWVLPSLDAWSAILSLPYPVDKLVLEVAPGHTFTYAAGLPWGFGSPPPVPLPPGPRVELSFASPVMELRLAGTGTLFALRIPSGKSGVVELHAYAGPVTFAAQPLPAPPTVLTAYNLQQPPVTLNGPIDESTPVPPRPAAGFKLNWLPVTSGGFGAWPDDLDAGPPLDALGYVIEHRRVTPPATYGPWEPLSGGDNLTLGSRDATTPGVRLEYGCDLDALFPAIRPRSADAGLALYLSDIFGENDPTTGLVRPAQPFGSYHQYQIRAMDAVGRVSGTATLSNVVRLEKHVPPPPPAGPQPPPALDAQGHVSAPPGPRARAIVRDAPGLTPADAALLGAHQNAIVLEWGWRQQERELDPSTAEFRVYSSSPPDVVHAVVTGVVSAAPNWQLALATDLPLVADELAGQWISSNGYPFLVVSNGAGTSPAVVVEPSKLQPATQPVAGPVVFGRPLRPEHTRPAGWAQRVAVYPLTAADTYRHVFYDVLALSPAQPRAVLWVGVAAADAQAYVPDERGAGLNANRPGNESAVAACTVAARYRGQPVFSVPPPLGDVPELVTDEPTGRQILVPLDLVALLAGALPAGAPIALERCSSDEILARVAVSGSDVVLTHPDGSHQTIAFPNPTDHATVLATLNSNDPQRLANRYLLHLVVAASDPQAFFTRISGDIATVGVVNDRLAPKPGRFLYFARAADALGHLSADGAILPVVVRVPSTATAATPRRRALTTTNSALALTVALGIDPDTTAALLFAAFSPPGADPAPQGEAELLRIPNRRDLYPNDGLRLRLADGTLLAPLAVKNLADPDVTAEPDGTRVATLSVPAAHGAWATVWCYALTRDGVPSYVCGPFSTGVGA